MLRNRVQVWNKMVKIKSSVHVTEFTTDLVRETSNPKSWSVVGDQVPLTDSFWWSKTHSSHCYTRHLARGTSGGRSAYGCKTTAVTSNCDRTTFDGRGQRYDDVLKYFNRAFDTPCSLNDRLQTKKITSITVELYHGAWSSGVVKRFLTGDSCVTIRHGSGWRTHRCRRVECRFLILKYFSSFA